MAFVNLTDPHKKGSAWYCRSYSAYRIKSLRRKPKAEARALAISIPTLTFPNSIELMYVRWTLAFSAKSSWEMPNRSRALRTARPNVRLENLVAFGTPYF